MPENKKMDEVQVEVYQIWMTNIISVFELLNTVLIFKVGLKNIFIIISNVCMKYGCYKTAS